MFQGRTGTAIPSHMKKMLFRLLSSVSKSSVSSRREAGFAKHGAGRSMDGLEQDAPASVPGMGMDLSYEPLIRSWD